ncbi:MAG: alpha/beta hydrolase [Solirubrobacterales bacterium]
MDVPRLPTELEFKFLRRVCAMRPRTQRRLFGEPPELDGQVLATDVHALIELARLSGAHSYTNGLAPLEAREFNSRSAAATQPPTPIPMARVENLSIPTAAGPMGARFYLPPNLPGGTAPPLLVYYHGGGWVIGDLDTHDGLCRFLAAAAGVAVLSIDYRLAPEHPFPAAVEDAWDALSWAAVNAHELGVDPSRIAVGGDSAGGNLAGGVSIRAREEGAPTPAMQLLLYPVTDSADDPRSRTLFADGFLLTKGDMDHFEGFYLPNAADANDPRVSIFKALDLSGLPRAYVATAGFDPLRDEGEAYAIRMREAGVTVALRRYPSLIHGFANQVYVSRSSRAAMLEVAGALRMGLAAGAA